MSQIKCKEEGCEAMIPNCTKVVTYHAINTEKSLTETHDHTHMKHEGKCVEL